MSEGKASREEITNYSFDDRGFIFQRLLILGCRGRPKQALNRRTKKLAGRAKKTENRLKLKNRIIDHNQASFRFDGHRRKQCRR